MYPITLTNIVDGDTMDVRAHMGLGVNMDIRLRIAGIDTPETWRPKTDAENIHGTAATFYASQLLTPPLKIRSYGWAVYNRVEADIILSDGSDFATRMRDAGFEKHDSYE
jgi:endonuclease YncB( thermonuclease family)